MTEKSLLSQFFSTHPKLLPVVSSKVVKGYVQLCGVCHKQNKISNLQKNSAWKNSWCCGTRYPLVWV